LRVRSTTPPTALPEKLDHGEPMTPWIAEASAAEASGIRLLCFPAAGTGASFFAPWRAIVSAPIVLCPIRPPGRESRIGETAYDEMKPLVDAAVEALVPLLDQPFALFGHCSGSLIAFEFARLLEKRGSRLPLALLVSAQGAPDERTQTSVWNIDELSRPELLERLRAVGIADETVLGNDELMDLLEPMIRADVSVADRYHYRPAQPLSVPIAAIGDTAEGDERFSALCGWRRHTAAAFTLRLVPGSSGYGPDSWMRVGKEVVAEVLQASTQGQAR